MIALRLASMTATDQPSVLASGTIATRPVHHLGIAHAPLQRLHAAHRGADHRYEADAEMIEQKLLRSDHIADEELRKFYMRLRRRVRRGGGEPIADRVGADDEELVRI